MTHSQQISCSFSQSGYDNAMLRMICLLLFLFCVPNFASAQSSSTALAETMIAKGRDVTAINILKREVKKHPADYQAWFMLGVTQAKRRQFHDAIRAFNKVVELQPSLAEPHNNLAVIYNELGDLRAAVRELETSLELNPAYGTAYENIGDLYVKLAAQSYKKALIKNDSSTLQHRYERLLRIRDADSLAVVKAATLKKAAAPVVEKPAPVQPVAQPPAPSTTAVVADVQSSVTGKSDAVTDEQQQQLLQAIELWRSAWSKQDIEGYYAAYDDSFGQGERFKTRKAWKKYKEGVIRNKKFIKVELENIVISAQPKGLMKVVLVQHYSSDSYKSDDQKEMIFRHTDTGWKIIHEASL